MQDGHMRVTPTARLVCVTLAPHPAVRKYAPAAVEVLRQDLGRLGSELLWHGPQDLLHHGEVLQVLVRLKQGIAYSNACQEQAK